MVLLEIATVKKQTSLFSLKKHNLCWSDVPLHNELLCI